MNKVLFILLLIALSFPTIAQDDLFNYQGVARNSAGQPLANKTLGIKIEILQGSASGLVVYQESHSVITNAFGLFNLSIGSGTPGNTPISQVNWALDKHFIRVSMDADGGTNYMPLGTQQLLSVPYSKVSSAINIYQDGTNNAEKMVVAHSPELSTSGISYNDTNDVFHFKSDGVNAFSVDLTNLSINYPHQSKGLGKVLTSDDDGNATWQDKSTKYTSINIPNCPTLTSVTTTMTKLTNLGTFNKIKDNTYIQLDFSTHFYINALLAGATGVVFELRIDDTKTTLGSAIFLLKEAAKSTQGTITGVFPNLPIGNHTISIWVRTSVGTGSFARIDEGCWNSLSTNNLLVKEFE